MAVEMQKGYEYIQEEIERMLSYNFSDSFMRLEFDENENRQFNFDLDYVKTYLSKVKEQFPNNKFKLYIEYVMKENFILDTNKCKELEEIDNYLRDKYGMQLLIRAKKDFMNSYGFRMTLYANRQIDELADIIKNLKDEEGNELSPFEKFMFVYESVTDFIYNDEGEKLHFNSSHWIPVLNGDKIVCTGYSSLIEAICERIFDENEIKILGNSVDVYNSEGEYLGGHANNIIFINDPKYKIKGMFYLDSCWDSITKEDEDKAYAYCCIPLIDIHKNKKYKFKFRETYIEDLQKEYKKFFMTGEKKKSFFDKFKLFKFINEAFEMSSDRVSLQYFIDNYESLNNNGVVPIKAFVNSFYLIGAERGLEGEELKEFVSKRMNYSIARCKHIYDEGCISSLTSYIYKEDAKENKGR